MALVLFSVALVGFGILLLGQRELQVTHTRRLTGPVATGLSLLYLLGGLVLSGLGVAMLTVGAPTMTENATASYFRLLSIWLGLLGVCALTTIGVIIWTCARRQPCS